jgi:hypothetical protein
MAIETQSVHFQQRRRFFACYDAFADDGFSDMELSPAGLQPTLESGYGLENAQIPEFDPGDNPSAAAVLDAVAYEFPLNRKQRMVAERIIHGALARKDHPYDCSKRDQLLTYIGSEGNRQESNNQSNSCGDADIEARA